MAAAISAKREASSLSVVLIEALPRVGKKILATGNGRCNLTNMKAAAGSYNTSAVFPVMKSLPPHKVVRFFSSAGLECLADGEGRVYPMSNSASSVLDCLRYEINRLGVEVKAETKITSVVNNNGAFILNSNIKCKKLILATGGKSSPAQGSDGSGYPLLKSLGHGVTPLYPGLVQLTVRENVKSLKGVRARASIELKTADGKIKDRSAGEVLFTDYGLSGIAVMDISRSVRGAECCCVLNLVPELSKDTIANFLVRFKKRNPSLPVEDALCGILPKKLGEFLIKCAGIRSRQLSDLSLSQIRLLAEKIKTLTFNVTGTNGFSSAQITVGGADIGEFDMTTLESRKVKGLYCTGELLDVDSVCGGFNLQWAWASGIVAGKAAAKNV